MKVIPRGLLVCATAATALAVVTVANAAPGTAGEVTGAPSHGANVAIRQGDVWSDPGELNSWPRGEAQVSNCCKASDPTDYLQATRFHFHIPAHVTIKGVRVQILRNVWDGYATDATIRLIDGDRQAGTNLAHGSAWPQSHGRLGSDKAWATFGGDGKTWGLSLTPAQVNAPAFGVAIQATLSHGFALASVFHVHATVYYTLPTGRGTNRASAGSP